MDSPVFGWILGRFSACVSLTIALACVSVPVQAQSLSRGPYLQNGSTTAVTVRWRTSSNAASVVRFGTSASNLDQTVSNTTAKTEHELRLTGLSPNTKYYYSVETASAALASGADYYYETSPSAAKPTRIWVLGDPGTANSSQTAVRNAYYNFTGSRHTDLWLMLGDNAYDDGTDSEYQSAVFNMYPTVLRNSVLWPTLGNHDGHSASSSSQTGPYYNVFTLPRNAEAGGVASGTEAYYSFDYGNIHFVCLNSYDVDRAATGAMLTWLKSDLAANTKDWLVAFFHHPPYSKGSHNSDSETELVQMRENALPILEDNGVDLVLAGHSHSYERSKFLDGHYGSSSSLTSAHVLDSGSGREDGDGAYQKAVGPVSHEGAVYAVPGASGQTSGGSLNHPAMYVSLNVLGSFVLDIDGSRLDAQYLDNNGTRRDYFTLLKGGSSNAAPTVSISSPSSGATFTAPANITVEAAASDSDGSVSHVDFYAGSTLVGSDTSSPYSVTWSSVAAGSYSLTAVAFDNAGASRTSTAIPISVQTAGGSAPVTVTLQNGVNSYSGTTDASLRSDNKNTNYGNSTTLLADGSPDYAALLRFDLSSISAGKTVTAAQLSFNVVNTSSGSYTFYALKRTWDEAQVNWNRALTGTNWQTAGASGSNDRETTALGTFPSSSTGSITITLNAAGIAKLQSWINDPASNYGFILLNYSNSDGLDLSSSEASTVSQRPKLTITYQ